MIKRKQYQLIQLSGEDGFTIIESLVALLVVAILLTAIAPVMILSTANRVQSRRVELATQAAKTFIDSVKTDGTTDGIASKVTTIEVELPPNDTRKIEDNLIDLKKMQVPATKEEQDKLYCYQKDGTIKNPTCTKDSNTLFYIQAAQIKTKGSQPSDSNGSRLGVRVYRSDVDFTKTVNASDGSSSDSSKQKVAQNAFAKVTENSVTDGVNKVGIGDRQSPLLEMTTEINSKSTSYNALCQRLAIKGTTCN